MVIYLLCFDLSTPRKTQEDQLGYWLDFLNSALPLTQSNYKYDTNTKWVIVPVGLRSDQQQPKVLRKSDLGALIDFFPQLPILPQLFLLSSTTSEKSVLELKDAIEAECSRIFSMHTALIPKSYHDILQDLMSPSNQPCVSLNQLFMRNLHGLDSGGFYIALQYLHAIGKIVLLKTARLVYPNANVASAIAANFVSPKKVRKRLRLKYEGIEILDTEQIGYLLNVRISADNV
jgi:hypothetical protein